MTFSKSMFWS